MDYKRLTITSILVGVCCSGGISAHAATHWASGVREVPTSDVQSKGLLGGSDTVSTSVFDITISIEEEPRGDFDSSVNTGSSDLEQRKFEDKIKAFADAVHYATEGSHKIGKVTVYSGFDQKDAVDVQWNKDCSLNAGPRANPNGFMKSGHRIMMCTNWDGAPSQMDTKYGGGYTLAHEFFHYVYGLYDEYKPQNSQCTEPTPYKCGSRPHSADTSSSTVMDYQWGGNSDSRYREFSTSNHAPFNRGSDTTQTNAQFRAYGKSAWDTLLQHPDNDTKWAWLFGSKRTQYTSLVQSNNYSANAALSELDIVWIENSVVEILIDRSGSMSGSAISNAKRAAKSLIDLQPAGDTAVGISSFSTSQTSNYPLTLIPEDGVDVRDALHSAVDGIYASGGTSLYDALLESLNKVSSHTGGIVYVLSDGEDTSSSATKEAVITAYKAAGIPLVSFGYGSGADSLTLTEMSNSTGGVYRYSPATLAEIETAMVEVGSSFSSTPLLISESFTVGSSSTSTKEIPIDDTLQKVMLSVSYDRYSGADNDMKLYSPSGRVDGLDLVCETVGSSTSCSIELNSHMLQDYGYGEYLLKVSNGSNTNDSTVNLLASGQTISGTSISIGVEPMVSEVSYPRPAVIRAKVNREAPIAGLSVIATITAPDDSVLVMGMKDDGKSGDNYMGDGVYATVVPYGQDGDYRVAITASNSEGKAATTYVGVQLAPAVDGFELPEPEPTAIVQNFVRSGNTSFVVTGYKSDDHSNSIVDSECTILGMNNSGTSGKIDYAGDVDCFRLVANDAPANAMLRVSDMTSDMDPSIQLWDSKGEQVLHTLSMDDSSNPVAGFVWPVNLSNMEDVIVSVKHADSSHSQGLYAVSFGERIHSDVKVEEGDSDTGTEPDPDEKEEVTKSGGGISFGMLLFLICFAMYRKQRK